jgi:hypothetical protein
MKITRDMTIKEVLAFDEEKMLNTLEMISGNFGRLRYKTLRKAMEKRVTVEQAAKIGRVPLSEVLFVLNLALGVSETEIAEELLNEPRSTFEFIEKNAPAKPAQISDIRDNADNVIFVDLLPFHEARLDPMPAITEAIAKMRTPRDVVLLLHPFDPIPLRELYAGKGFASWAEERRPGRWYIYLFKPYVSSGAAAMPPIEHQVYQQAFAAYV